MVKHGMKKAGRRSNTPHTLIILYAFLGMFLLLTSVAMPQDVAIGTATATVKASLVVVASQSLAFGDVYQGVAKSISKNSGASAGVFDITGAINSTLTLYMQLPDYVALANGTDRMVILFSTTDCDVDTAVAAIPGLPASFVGGFASEDPRNLPSGATTGDAGYCSLFLGGKVIPTIDQAPGSYSADIVLTVAYDGT